jgi:hypothetical protein
MANNDWSITEKAVIDRSGPSWWTNNSPTIDGESLVVKHTENGRSPGVSFVNDGGGHFVLRFVFGGDSNLPQGEAASLWANWNGLVVAAHNNLSFVIGNLDARPQMEITEGKVIVNSNIGVGTAIPTSKVHIVGNADTFGTVRFEPDPSKGPNHSHVHWDPTGDWYIRSAANNGIVVLQDQDTSANVGIGTSTPTSKLEVIGDVKVSGDIFLAGGADGAEDFDIVNLEKIEPGSVMVIDDLGKLEEANRPYDKRVAGVISGAGNFKPAITLDKQPSNLNRQPIALLGKVYCKVDAEYSSIEVGDLLTTSPTIGHAMKVIDPLKAFGAVIGKALCSIKSGRGLIAILVTLQ